MKRLLPSALLAALLGASFLGCTGYHRLDHRPRKAAWMVQGETVRIASFANRSPRLGLEETFRKALEHRIVAASPWKLVGQNAASRWVLQGTIEHYEVRALGLNLGTSTSKGAAGTASRVEVIVTGSMQLMDGQTGALVIARPSLTFSNQYRVDQNFASISNRELEVLDTLADDFAESFLTQLLEGSE
ncbi:MAG TPA: LPS assembly lipoprotein LptE [Holophaga sp.]|nr:LPS assembly lipoprotein LptE [Holophaga sp.]